jgi:hypothetical protein
MIYIATDGIKSIFGELIVLGLYIYSPPANLLAFDKIDFNNLPLFREALNALYHLKLLLLIIGRSLSILLWKISLRIFFSSLTILERIYLLGYTHTLLSLILPIPI